MVLADRGEDVESGHVGEADVEEDEVGTDPPIGVDAVLPRIGLGHLMGTVVTEEHRERGGDRDFIVDDQYACHAVRVGSGRGE
ncbi:hypothetical protein D3C83_100010 [compost metagenome]